MIGASGSGVGSISGSGNQRLPTLTDLLYQLASRSVTSTTLVGRSLHAIHASQPTLNAFRVVLTESALADAAEADRRRAAGDTAPLLGIPIAVKDDVDIAGVPTAFGTEGTVPPATHDAEVVRRLKAAGAVIVGKTNTCELGQWPFTSGPGFGHTRNPWSRPRLWRSVINELAIAEDMTKDNDVITVNYCVNYGGRAEIAEATKEIARLAAAGRLNPERITESTVANHLQRPDIPDVDLFLRTSGEQRSSNFMLWQAAYAEYIFQDKLWPDYDRRDLWAACEEYASRNRRFGSA